MSDSRQLEACSARQINPDRSDEIRHRLGTDPADSDSRQCQPAQRRSCPTDSRPGSWHDRSTLHGGGYRPLIVAYKNGAPIRLIGYRHGRRLPGRPSQYRLVNGKPAITIQVFKQPTANIIDTVDRVNQLLPLLQASIPPTIHLSVILDRTTTIRASIEDIEYTILISIGLVILVVFHLPAKSLGHDHSEHFRAALAARHVRCDVHAGI